MSPARKKAVAEEAQAEKTERVALAYPFTDSDGKAHEADSEVDLPRETAVEMIHYGRARAVATEAAASDGSQEG